MEIRTILPKEVIPGEMVERVQLEKALPPVFGKDPVLYWTFNPAPDTAVGFFSVLYYWDHLQTVILAYE